MLLDAPRILTIEFEENKMYRQIVTLTLVTSFLIVTSVVRADTNVDDFESYANSNGLRLTWIDGSDSNNGTGSTVYLDTDIYHNGAKSMKCDYNNSSSPYYSKVYRTYNTANDWTQGGVKFLSLFFHGSVDNDAEQMYVILQDDNDVNATVFYEGNANDLVQEDSEYWNLWNIRLGDFNDDGVDLSCIKKITLGLGGSGGSGTVCFDDIKLSPSRCAADYEYLPVCDFTRNAAVNFLDYAELAKVWLVDSNESDFDEIYDLDSNDVIDVADLGIFAEDWLWPDDQVDITVDADAIGGQISKYLTGFNALYSETTDNIRTNEDVTGYLIDMNCGILRFPGGEMLDYYHYDYPHYPRAVDAWGGPAALNSNVMDVNEFLAWCGEIGAEPMLGINMDSGMVYDRINDSINEAVNIVTYCNITNDYNVVYWYLSNESYGNSSHYTWTVEEYTEYVEKFGQAMKDVDPNIKLIVNWENKPNEPAYWAEWEYLIEEANEYIDIADIHWYWDNSQTTWNNWIAENPMRSRLWCPDCYNDYSPGSARYMGPSYAGEIERFYDEVNNINGVSYDVKLASLEWNVGNTTTGVEPSIFQAALMQAEMMGQFIEGGLYMATFWPFIWQSSQQNRYLLDNSTLEPRPGYVVFKMYKNALGQQQIATQTSKTYIRPVSALSQDGNTLWVYLLNKSNPGQAVRASVDISGFTAAGAEAIALTSPQLSSDFGMLKKLNVEVNPQTSKWESVLPPYSLTMLTFHK